MAEGLLVGGPYDGARLPSGPRDAFVWVGGQPKKPKGFKRPGAGRDLYRAVARERGVEVFLFSGYTHALCACGGYSELDASRRCQLCGAPLRSAAAAA